MKKLTPEHWISIVGIGITTIFSVIGFLQDSKFKFLPILCIILLAFCIFFLIQWITSVDNTGNATIIRKSKKYIRLFKKLLKYSEKVLNTYFDYDQYEEILRFHNKIRKISNNKILPEEKLKLLVEKYKNFPKKRVTKKGLKYCSAEQASNIYEIIHKDIDDLRRILLQLSKHRLRIKLGEYVIKYSGNEKERIDSYLDDIGWTYVLMGNNKKGSNAIEQGLVLINGTLAKYNDQTEKDSKYYDYIILKTRALRHLGTTYYTYRTAKEKVKEYLEEGLNLIMKDDVYNYFMKNNKAKYYRMRNGIKFNLLYFDYLNNKNNKISDEKLKYLYDEITKQIKELDYQIENENVHDDHRYVKSSAFRIQLYDLINDEAFKKEKSDINDADFKKIESLLNNNIYFDEALENYLELKISKTHYDIHSEIFKNN